MEKIKREKRQFWHKRERRVNGLQYENAAAPHKEDLVLVGYYKTEPWNSIVRNQLDYLPTVLGKGSINLVSGFEKTKYLLLHHSDKRLLVRLKGNGHKFFPKQALVEIGFYITSGDNFL